MGRQKELALEGSIYPENGQFTDCSSMGKKIIGVFLRKEHV